jgi:5-methylcytosine-specific restriction endonuclease McrA
MAPAVISYREAKAKGLKRYFTGKACKHGHIAERFVINCACTACTLERTDKWAAENLEIKLEFARDWRKRNPIYGKQWLKDHPDAKRRAARKWYLANAERAVRVAMAWGKRNPEKRRAAVRNYEARREGAAGSHTAEQILDLLDFQGWKCAGHHCNASLINKRHIDHIMPLILGGSNYIWNLQALCPTCNCSKNGKHPIAWAAENGIYY